MCIVTYFPTEKGFIFTSNRDEVSLRPTQVPKFHKHASSKLFYAKDLIGNGTWLAIDPKQKKLSCLLNAKGNVSNSKKENISRGKLPILSLTEMSILAQSKLIQFAPFMLIRIDFSKQVTIEEYAWNGRHLSHKNRDADKQILWCSDTLYSTTYKKALTSSFEQQVTKHSNWKDVKTFHENNSQPPNNTVFLKKDPRLQTISIKSCCIDDTACVNSYKILTNKNELEVKQKLF